ncbi:MAG: T9SS type A sorting domain-containing protein [Sphingobacteriaceae bacterium]|nr:T9SS type A sorting domain-containing protein [Sphingobacteriaceae bacterium]
MRFFKKILPPFCFFFHFSFYAQISGCTDPLATNFNSLATLNDGSCLYSASSITPYSSYSISDSIIETSGLIFWNGNLFTHNDNTDKLLYQLDTLSGVKINTINLTVRNIDWEEVSQDANYIYVGDFGNNAGNRTNLKIFRFNKAALLQNNIIVDSIQFSYSNQVNFNPPPNSTDFDCEAFIVGSDSIYLFTKQWGSNNTSFYSLSKNPGTYTANLRGTINVQGLITGAVQIENKSAIVLCGYNNTLQPFLFLLYDYTGNNFGSGNKRKLNLNLPFHQIEGIAYTGGERFIVTNEKFVNGPINTSQKIHKLNLNNFLNNYLTTSYLERSFRNNQVNIYPNPANEHFCILGANPSFLEIIDLNGKVVKFIAGPFDSISTSDIQPGIYFLKIVEGQTQRQLKLLILH